MTAKGYHGQVVWILGASSGIGLALAHELAAQGAVLALSARRRDELEKLGSALGPQHKIVVLDVTDAQAVLRAAQAISAAFGHIDRVVFLAAAYTPATIEKLDAITVKQTIDVNLTGAFNIIQAIIPIFKTQKPKGQIALCGSVAGYIGFPNGQPYSATKAAIINLAESLYAELGDTMDVKLISPGFVRTPLTDKNSFSMPMIITPEQAAREIAVGLLSRRFEIHFPRKFTYLMKIIRVLPYALLLWISRKMRS